MQQIQGTVKYCPCLWSYHHRVEHKDQCRLILLWFCLRLVKGRLFHSQFQFLQWNSLMILVVLSLFQSWLYHKVLVLKELLWLTQQCFNPHLLILWLFVSIDQLRWLWLTFWQHCQSLFLLLRSFSFWSLKDDNQQTLPLVRLCRFLLRVV